ncbi:MAG: porin [Pseudomonadota bacterium]
MKKVLLGTSAIALAAATSANAAEWNVKVGGYHNQMVAFASSDQDNNTGADFDGVDVKQNAEIFFLPSITLDNGLKFGANVQLESAGGTGTPDTIDESYLYVRGSFGEINLGSENSAGYKMTYGAPNKAIIAFNSPSTDQYIPWTGNGAGNGIFRSTLGSTFIENDRNNDADRITYYTPRFAGFQVGVSYARDGLQDTNGQQDINAGGTLSDIFDIGANYVNDFGGVNVALSARWGIASKEGADAVAASPTVFTNAAGVVTVDPTGGATPAGSTEIVAGTAASAAGASTDPTVLAFGANVGFGGFTIGGSWAEQNDSGNNDGTAFDVGVSYETGPWGFSAVWFHGENVDDDQGFASGLDEEQDTFGIGIDYKLAKGVRLNAFGAYVDFSEDDPAAATNRDTDGFIIGTGIGLSF